MSDEAANVPAAQKSGELPAALDPTVDEDSFHPHPPPPNSRRRLATRRSSWGMCGACGVMELEQGRKGLRTEGLEWSREGGDSPLSPAWGARRSSSERNGLAGSSGRRRDEHTAAGQEKGLTNFARVDAGWTSFLKSLASFSGDLSGLTAPPFILSPTSLSEFPSYWGEPKDLFTSIADGKTPEDRQLRVTKWFLSTLSGQFTRREKETGSEKKPLNPFLGEQFLGSWDNGELVLTVEQVSHHPPITAYHLENKKRGIVFEGNCAQKTSFSARMISVKQVGHGILRVKLGDGSTESYLVTLPKLKIEGLWTGKPYVELTETSYIQGSHGLTSTIKYSGAGWVTGTSHSHTTTITTGPGGPTLYTITGTWTGESKFVKPSKEGREGTVFLDAGEEGMREPISVKPVEQQGEYESRRAWKAVADGIRSGDYNAASVAKGALENAERQRRKDELANGQQFQLRLFDLRQNDPEYAHLAALLKFKPEEEDSWILKAQ